MKHRFFLIGLITLIFFLAFPSSIDGKMLESYQRDDVHILLIHSSASYKKGAQVKIIDLLLHHFTSHVTLVSDDDVTKEDIKSATHVIYFGEQQTTLREEVLSWLKEFSGVVIAMGKNVEQLPFFEIEFAGGEVFIDRARKPSHKEALLTFPYVHEIHPIKVGFNEKILLYGERGQKQYPLWVKTDKHYYFSATTIEQELKYVLAEILHDAIPNDHKNEHYAYIRLEDIHPMSDSENLWMIGEQLYEREIPFMLVVIPVYITPETGERVYFSDSPELVEVLQKLQDMGGTVISHGYTHQYRDSETGEGFEFWDVENQQFIIEENPNKSIEKIRAKEDFPNKKDYEQYIERLLEQEQSYIQKRLESSIHELVYYDLYPVAFEAPHYTMSQQGYEITRDYFLNILGQIQYSDEAWEIMGTPPYPTTATFLHGMTVYPETIGYVDPTIKQPIQEIQKQLKRALTVRDSMIGGFYHPYLGLEYLDDFITLYEEVPNLKWFDLRQFPHTIKTPDVSISTDGLGNIEVKGQVDRWIHFQKRGKAPFFEKVLWIVSGIVLIFIFLFISFILYLRFQLRKRLFMERKSLG